MKRRRSAGRSPTNSRRLLLLLLAAMLQHAAGQRLPQGMVPVDTVQPFAAVDVDTALRFQTMEGWGASSNFYEENLTRYDTAARRELFDRVYRDLGSSILCIRLYATFQSSQGGAWNWGAMAAQRMIVGEALARGSIRTIWLKVSSPPGWMKDNGSDANGGHVTAEHYQDYADYLSYYIRHMRDDYGIRIDAVSIFNEPGFSANYESTTTTPAEYRDILKTVAATFRRDSLESVALIGPETGHITDGWSYFTTLLSDTVSAAALSRITTHQYGDQRLLYGTGPADNWEGLRDLAGLHGKSVWETEMFIGGPGMATRDIDEGLRAALLIWTALTRGNVTAWHYWQYHHPDDTTAGASQGVIALNPDRKTLGIFPRYYVLMQWMRHVPPGAVRVEAESSNPDLYVAAFTHGGTLIVVAFNRTTTDIETAFRFPFNAGAAAHFRTSATENHAPGPEPMPGDVATFLTVKARSISTLVMPLGLTGAVDAQVPQRLSVRVSPNPASSTALLQLSGAAAGTPARIAVTDMLGRTVLERAADVPVGGMLPIDLRALSSGAYRIGVAAGNAAASTMIHVAR